MKISNDFLDTGVRVYRYRHYKNYCCCYNTLMRMIDNDFINNREIKNTQFRKNGKYTL